MRKANRFFWRLGAAGVLLAALAGDGHGHTAYAQGAVEQTIEDGCTGRAEVFTVPPGLTQLAVEAEGASGNASGDLPEGSGRAGRGGRVTGVLAVTPGSLLTITAGCRDGYGDIPGAPGGGSTVTA